MGKIATDRVTGLYRTSRAEEFGLSEVQFAVILEQLGLRVRAEENSGLEDSPSHPHLEDLVLARACAGGSER